MPEAIEKENSITTRYYGSKKKLLPVLQNVFNSIEFNSACDIFGGTGVVSHMLMSNDKEVHYNDALGFNTVFAKALLEPNLPPKSQVYDFIDSIKPTKGFITKEFENVFYTSAENMWLDGFCKRFIESNNLIAEIAFYGVGQAALMKRPFNLFHRANLYLRLNNAERNFGNLTTWETPFIKLAKKAIDELYAIKRTGKNYKISNKDAEQLSSNCDLLYIDPPYLKKKHNDCYLKKYHFLEGMYRYNDWPEIISKRLKSRTLDQYDHVSEMSSIEGFKRKISACINNFSGEHIVLSYADKDVDSLKFIKSTLKNNDFKYRSIKTESKHALSKSKLNEITIYARRVS